MPRSFEGIDRLRKQLEMENSYLREEVKVELAESFHAREASAAGLLKEMCGQERWAVSAFKAGFELGIGI
jgi:hypothetical protein